MPMAAPAKRCPVKPVGVMITSAFPVAGIKQSRCMETRVETCSIAAGGNDTFVGHIGPDSNFVFYGDAGESLVGHSRGGNDSFTASGFEYNNHLYGDAGGDMADHAAGGNDSFAVSGTNPFNFVFGDAGGNMSASAVGGNDTFNDSSDVTLADQNVFSGDAGGNMSGSVRGGDDTFNKTGLGGSTFYGDAAGDMSDRAHGGDDTFQASGTQDQNIFYGDAGRNMGDQAVGGDDTYIGGNVFSQLVNQVYGDASTMSGHAHGGNDTLVGGDDPNAHPAGSYETILVGDARSMSDYAGGGDDRLVSGTGNDDIWGDAQMMLGFAKGGNDTFVFNFDNGHDKIEDFGQGLSNLGTDHIDVSALRIENFGDLSISSFDPATHESTIMLSPGNDVVVHSEQALRPQDFIFAAYQDGLLT